jgi:hypothetical protein
MPVLQTGIAVEVEERPGAEANRPNSKSLAYMYMYFQKEKRNF